MTDDPNRHRVAQCAVGGAADASLQLVCCPDLGSSSSLVHAVMGVSPQTSTRTFDRFAVVHRAVAVGRPVQAHDPVEDAARLDSAFEDIRQQAH